MMGVPRFVWVLAAVALFALSLIGALVVRVEEVRVEAAQRAESERACLARWAEKSSDINHQQDALDSIRAASEMDLQSLFLDLLFDPPPDARQQFAQELRRHLRILERVDRIPEYPTLEQTCEDLSFR